jgi:hypothetical protein
MTAKAGQAAPKGLDGHLVTRVAMSLGSLARFQQQIQQVMGSVGDAQQSNAKTTS